MMPTLLNYCQFVYLYQQSCPIWFHYSKSAIIYFAMNHISVTTEEKELRRNQNICFHLNNQDPTVIWPNSANGSCVCQGWYHIADCGCNSNMLVYNQGFNFTDWEICWTNLKNNTKLHFVLESSNPVDVQNLVQEPQVNRYFQSSYNIVIKGKVI